jgi:hemerythrin-like domain-containing protein
MAEMSMNRVIHGAFRRDLKRFEDALAAFTDGDAGQAEQLWMAWTNFDDQLTRHHVGEHEIAWPTLRQLGVSEELITKWDSEHDRIAEGLRTADAAMRAFRGSPTAANAQAARDAVAELRVVAGEHLDHEEADLEPFYLAKKDTPELKAMGRKFGQMSPPAAGTFFAWLQEGATSEEAANLRRNVPGPVVAILGGVFGRTYRRTIAPVWRA